VAREVDPETVLRVIESRDEYGLEYQSLRGILAGLRDRFGLDTLYAATLDKQGISRIVADAGLGEERLPLWGSMGPVIKKEVRGALAGQLMLTLLTKENGRLVKEAYIPIKGRGRVVGYAVCRLDAARAQTIMNNGLSDIILGGIFLLIVGFVGAFIVACQLSDPLLALSQHAERILAGDLTKKLEAPLKKEYGVIARTFVRLQEELRRFIARAEDAAEDVNRQAELIRQYAQDLWRVSETAADTIAQIGQGSRQSAGAVAGSAQDLAGVGAALDGLNRQVAELRDSLGGVEVLARQGAQAAGDLAEPFKEAEGGIEQSAEQNRLFIAKTQEVTELVAAIENIATQTSTLALNATIEAARAGEFGRGFAVVARRIQRLAVSTKETVTRIRELLAEAETAGMESTAAAEKSQEAVKTVAAALRGVTEALEGVTSRMERVAARVADLSGTRDDLERNAARLQETMRAVSESTAKAAEGTMDSGTVSTSISNVANQLISLANFLGSVTAGLDEDFRRYRI
ncbi:MAG: methyl-accepting chemotaxis protein, partial [Bacteroidota bacterium]